MSDEGLPPAGPSAPAGPRSPTPAPGASVDENAPAPGANGDVTIAPVWPPTERALMVAMITTVVVTIVSRVAPDAWANTAVGGVFLAATWLTVLRGNTSTIRAFGMSLGGLTEPEALDPLRLLRDGAIALGWALLFAVIFFPPFWFGYRYMWTNGAAFHLSLPEDFGGRALGQVLVIALPEEAFFRGYLQSSLDGAWKDKCKRVLGAEIGPGWLLSSVVFAIGHVLTVPNPGRLAVFFPALLFGWLRARTGGIGAGIVFHAMCNLLSAFLAHTYGIG